MKHTDGRFQGALGESYWQAWVPDAPKAVVVLSHGVSEHSGRYPHVGARFSDAGYAVYALDHHGHGRSAGTPGNVGRFAGVVADLQTLRDLAEKEHPGLPVFLLGHSLGSLITLDYLVTKGQAGLSGVVLSGAATDPTVGTKIERLIAPLISRIAPNLAITDIGVDNISRDRAVVDAYLNDPHVYTGKMRARTGAEALAALSRVIKGLPGLTLPILLLHGGDDRITASSGSRIVHDGIGSPDKTMTVYDGLFHEIFNEPEQDAVIDDALSWLDSHA